MQPQKRQPAPEPPQGDIRMIVRVFLPLAITALAILLYVNALKNPFIIDAPDAIATHPDVIQPEGLTRLWTHDASGGRSGSTLRYQPVTVLTYHLNARLWSLRPDAFRIVNILLLAGLGCLSAMWVGRYTRRTVAWLAAALLVAHPINTEMINHIVGRNDLLAMIGIVGVLYSQRRALEIDCWQWWRVLIAAFFAVVAVGSKETGLIVVPAAFLQGWLFRYPKAHQTQAASVPLRNVLAVTALLVIAPMVVYISARAGLLSPSLAVDYGPAELTASPLEASTFGQRLPAAFALAWFYAKQVVWPDTSFNHTPAVIPGWMNSQTMLGVIVVLLWLAALAVSMRKRHWLCIPLLIALGQFVAVCSLIIPLGTYAANRFALPMVFAAVCAVANWFNGLTRGSTRKRAVAVIPCAVAVLAMGYVVWHVNPQWGSEVERYQADLDAQPENPVALYSLGCALADDREYEAAVPMFQRVLLQRDAFQCRYKLADAYFQIGDGVHAEEQYKLVIARFPYDWRAHLTLAEGCMKKNELEDAERHIGIAHNIAPSELRVTYALANLASRRKQYARAMRLYESILIRQPDYAAARKSYEELLDAQRAKPEEEK